MDICLLNLIPILVLVLADSVPPDAVDGNVFPNLNSDILAKPWTAMNRGLNRQIMETILLQYQQPPTHQKKDHWNYQDTESWIYKYRECGGAFQSPINIDPTTAIRENYPRIFFGNYDRVAAENITNNGHTVLLHLPTNYPDNLLPFVMAGGLMDRYNFVQLHFHWGGAMHRGSEHLIANKRYFGELHIVHYNAKYGSFAEATKHSDGLAVLAILIELGQQDNIALQQIVQQLEQVMIEGDETNLLSPIPIGTLLPDNTGDFYRYQGSLTTPGCQEIVSWIVFNTPIFISERQLQRFRRLFDAEGHVLQDNVRPVHLKHGRIVTYRSENGLPLDQSSQLMLPPPINNYNLAVQNFNNLNPLEIENLVLGNQLNNYVNLVLSARNNLQLPQSNNHFSLTLPPFSDEFFNYLANINGQR